MISFEGSLSKADNEERPKFLRTLSDKMAGEVQ